MRSDTTERGFVPVPGVVAGRGNSMSYFRSHDDVAVFDTHGQNFLISGMRMVPIDELIVYADEDLCISVNAGGGSV